MLELETHESTIANADLWARYFRDEWSRWLSISPRSESLAPVADATAARVAGFLTLVAAGPIAWLYQANAPQATQIIEDSEGARETPLPAARREKTPAGAR